MRTSLTLISALMRACSPMVNAPPSDSMVPSRRPWSSSSPENASAPLNSQSEVRTVVVRVPLVEPVRGGSVVIGGRLEESMNVDIRSQLYSIRGGQVKQAGLSMQNNQSPPPASGVVVQRLDD